MITISDIAEMANVSRSTVSRALNNSGYVSEDARKRIDKVIEETGYMPSEYAKSLRTKKTKVIGVILPTIQTETSSKVVTGLGKVLSEQGYEILLANTNLDREKEIEYLDLLRVRQVDGIVLIATNTEPALMEKIRQLSIPLIILGQEAEGITSIVYNDYEVSREVTSTLIEKGHEKIAFIGVDESDKAVGYLRKKGYLDEMAGTGIPVEDAWIQKAVFDIDSGYDAMQAILAYADQQPTAVFAVTDRLAVGAMTYLKQQGYHIPKDIAVTGIGNSEISQYVDPPLTTVDYQNEEAGMEAGRKMMEMLQTQKNHKKMVLNYRLIFRESV
ncbi:LacI family DNA-binding transcriptional regulator [Salibacterium sp. K-3]